MGAVVRSPDLERCIDACFKTHENYLDCTKIIRILDDAIRERSLGKMIGSEVRVRTATAPTDITPDALVDLGNGDFACVEIKTGEGGDVDGIIAELKKAAVYAETTTWLHGNHAVPIVRACVLFICREDYCRRLKDLIDTNRPEVMNVLQSGHMSILKWYREGSLIRIMRVAGSCGHRELDELLLTCAMRETQRSALVTHAEFLFVPRRPPSQYTATQLLTYLVPLMPRALDDTPAGSFKPYEREFTIDELYRRAKECFPISRRGDQDQVRRSWIEEGLVTLMQCGYATKDTKYRVKLPKSSSSGKLTKSICSKLCRKQMRMAHRRIPLDENQPPLSEFV